MTTTPETCRCECEECLALRAAEDDPGCGATVAAFEHDGGTYEIDHLAIGSGSQWGEFAVYCDGEEVAEFAIAGPASAPSSAAPGPAPKPSPATSPAPARSMPGARQPGNQHGQPQLIAGFALGATGQPPRPGGSWPGGGDEGVQPR